MLTNIKALWLLVIIALGASIYQIAKYKDNGLIVHIASGIDRKHSAMMGLQLAKSFAQKGVKVLVLFDINGPEVLAKDNDFTFKDFTLSSHALLKEIIELGACVQACEHCMHILGYTMENLIDGVTPLNKDALFDFCSGRIVALDY